MSAIIHSLLGISGYPLIGVICGLILLEELGIPMPMAPGDLLLVLTGISIATGRVNPFVVVSAVYFSALIGAIGGRELCEHIGSTALPRIARLLLARVHDPALGPGRDASTHVRYRAGPRGSPLRRCLHQPRRLAGPGRADDDQELHARAGCARRPGHGDWVGARRTRIGQPHPQTESSLERGNVTTRA